MWTGGQCVEMKVSGASDGEDVADGSAGGDTFEPRLPTEDRNGNSSDGEDWSEYESETLMTYSPIRSCRGTPNAHVRMRTNAIQRASRIQRKTLFTMPSSPPLCSVQMAK